MPPRLPLSSILQARCCECAGKRTDFSAAEAELFTARLFHTSNARPQRHTRLRKGMHEWLDNVGTKLREPLEGSTNYLGAYDRSGALRRADSKPQRLDKQAEVDDDKEAADVHGDVAARDVRSSNTSNTVSENSLPPEEPGDLVPYPLNPQFVSQRVLSEDLREQLYKFIVEDGRRLEDVAAALRIDTRRVAAVVRLKTIERRWLESGKKLARPYSEAVMAMLPQTTLETVNTQSHETVNDLNVLSRTRTQLFWPTSESRQFNRSDAANAFKVLPADQRLTLPALVKAEQLTLQGLTRKERVDILKADNEKQMKKEEERAAAQKIREEQTQTIVPGRRWDFKFQDFNAENVGKGGRSRDAIGIRYGLPHEDRKRGIVKIPIRVE